MGLTFTLETVYYNMSLQTIEKRFKLDYVYHRVPDNLQRAFLLPLSD